MLNRFFIPIALCLLWSCQASQQTSNLTDRVESPSLHSPSQPGEGLSLQGTFRSTQGVKTRLSCFCNNGGYLKTSVGETIAICLDGLNASINCRSLEVSGSYTLKSNDPEPENPCSKEEMKLFQVTSYNCK